MRISKGCSGISSTFVLYYLLQDNIDVPDIINAVKICNHKCTEDEVKQGLLKSKVSF